ncbi:MAG: hypothetical protein M0Z66_15660 [Thermaerobacter sp.]|nr:hypothetical protein [Thermaerobacter sp.]
MDQALTLEEIWRRCAALEQRLRRKGPSYQPFPGVLEFHGVAVVSGADFRQPPNPQLVAAVLQRLLDAAQQSLDFEAQVEVLDLMQDLEDLP